MAQRKRMGGGTYNLFVSWSKPRSKGPAVAFADWLGGVVQFARPWISTEDIPKGSAWFSQISSALEGCNVGVIFVTRENMREPWIHLEAGAILKAVSDNARVCPVLLDLPTTDLDGPLASLNATTPERGDMLKLILEINRAIGSDVDAAKVTAAFEGQWPTLEKALKVAPPKQQEPHRNERQLLEEILLRVRSLEQQESIRWPPPPPPPPPAPGGRSSHSFLDGLSDDEVEELKREKLEEPDGPDEGENEPNE